MEVLVFFLLLWTGFAALGYYIAGQKLRPPIEGVLLGFLFGPLGVLIVALLPDGVASKRRPSGARPGRSRSFGGTPEYRDDWDAPKDDEIDVMDYLNDNSRPEGKGGSR